MKSFSPPVRRRATDEEKKLMLIGFTHVISPRMSQCELTFVGRQAIDHRRALGQHEEYCGLLRHYGVQVKQLSKSINHPDCCFVEDTAIVFKELAVIASMGAASRRGESLAIQKALAPYRELAFIKLPATIDGGDVVKVGKTVFVGQSRRTNAEAVAQLKSILTPYGYRVRAVEVKGSLHLTTACSALDDETLLVNARWIDPLPFAGFNLLRVPDDEPWAANVLRVGDTICLEAGAPRTLELLSKRHDRLEVLDISEFRKAEGSLTCLSIIFEEGGAN